MINNGYYWIKPNAETIHEAEPQINPDGWFIAYYDGEGWHVSGYWDYLQDTDIEQVDERIIERINDTE